MEAAGDACALQWLGLAVQLPHLHQTGHLILRNFNGLATPVGQADVSWGDRGASVMLLSPFAFSERNITSHLQ